jgi:hypothetical protein
VPYKECDATIPTNLEMSSAKRPCRYGPIFACFIAKGGQWIFGNLDCQCHTCDMVLYCDKVHMGTTQSLDVDGLPSQIFTTGKHMHGLCYTCMPTQ